MAMEALIDLLCPNSHSVWNKSGSLSECLENLVLGFGANCATLILVLVLGISRRNRTRIWRVSCSTKFFLFFIPAVGATLTFVDTILLLNGEFLPYHKWLFRGSQFAVWASIVLSSLRINYRTVFCNRIMCFWWIGKMLLQILHLVTIYNSFEVYTCLKDSSFVLLDIMFGLSINIIRAKQAYSLSSSMEDPLLSLDSDIEEAGHRDSGNARYFDTVAFNSISSVMKHGATKQLEFENLLELPFDMNPSSCHDRLLSSWKSQSETECSKPSLFWAIFRAYGWPYFRLGLLKVLNDSVGFAGPLLLNRMIKFLQAGSGSGEWDGYALAFSLGAASVFKSILDTQYTFRLNKLRLKLRSGIMTLIYQQCLCLNQAARSEFSEGEIQTFMSIDVDRAINLCNCVHDMWSLPFQIGVALYLLYTQVKFAFIAGTAITVLLIPVNKWISTMIASASEKMMKQKDERIRRTGELLAHIRTLKMYSWEILFSDWIMETRSVEVKHLSTRKYLDAWCVFFWATTPTLFSLFTFGLFVLMGNHLDAATVFTCLALFNTLISPLNSFPWVINGLIDVVISTRRLTRFLSASDCKPEREDISEEFAIVFNNACCSWSIEEKNKWNFAIHMSLGLQKGSLVAVIGEVGSGKSSMLSSVLGEMKVVHGSVQPRGSMAYVSQVPWILSGTVRDNVLFGKDYDSKRYSDTLSACALDVDISLMNGGDMAFIGEKGVNLSGGQRARLALARAIYSGSDIIILDDVLSAVDAQVARWILSNAILGPLMNNRTCLLSTHNAQAISSANVVIVMEKGHVRWFGRSSDLAASSYSELSLLNELDSDLHIDQEQDQDTQKLAVEHGDIYSSVEAHRIIEDEARKEGRVEFSVYKNYAVFSGCSITIIICVSAILMQASRNGNDLWLSYWVDTTNGKHQREKSTSFYLAILSVFCVINSCLTLARAFSFAFGGLSAAIKVHNTILRKIIDVPVLFFDLTPTGRILNRLSSDLYTIDDSLPFILNILLANFIGLIGIAVVLSYVQIFFLLLLLPFWYIYSKLQFFYRSTSREIRRLDSVSRSPIYASFTETLDGAATIRAFSSEEYFLTRFLEHVTLYHKTSYTELTASLWLSLRLQLLAAFVISFVALMAVIGSNGNLPISFGTPGLVGLALSYAAPVVSLLSSFLTSFTETEKEMVSLERALEYVNIPEEEQHKGNQSPNPHWPSQGNIEFRNVTMRYISCLSPALNDITFTIEAGSHVGIIGRTGAGKSSILNALFRLTPICGGDIIVDDIDICNIGARDLRARFAVVPQSPFLFEASLRDNLDPLHESDDSKIWKALERCHVIDEVESAGGLDAQVKRSETSFSVGQRQLLCLARALLKSSMVVCLDECTASVDSRTASILQNAISRDFRGATVITIAHRISTVLNMDNILVLDRAHLVEWGNPRELLRNESSRFSSFAKASTM